MNVKQLNTEREIRTEYSVSESEDISYRCAHILTDKETDDAIEYSSDIIVECVDYISTLDDETDEPDVVYQMTDKFEIVFSFDTTGSMYKYLNEVRQRLREMVKDLKRKIPGIRIAIFAHGDYCDAGTSYVTKYLDFTNDANTICDFVANVSKTDGGDKPECYELVMREVQEMLSWSRFSQKALVMIGDAPPHEKTYPLNTRCLDWMEETERLRNMDIKIYSVKCGLVAVDFYQIIAAKTFGYYMPLSDINDVNELLMKICFREAGLDNELEVQTLGSFIDVPKIVPRKNSKTVREPPNPAIVTDLEVPPPDAESTNENALRCFMCKTKKPANEFPITPLSEDCNHYPGYCYRCAVKYAKENGKCPHKECNILIDPDCEVVRCFEAKLSRMFSDYSNVLKRNRTKITGNQKSVVSVSTMNGDTAWVPYSSNMTIAELKSEVESQLGIKECQQKILFKDGILKVNNDKGKPKKLADYDVKENSSLTLIIPLLCIPENLDHVVFDLFWEFPKSQVDFLDASCFAFEKTEFIQVIDWNHSTNSFFLKDAIQHSAKNVRTTGGRVGHQTIHVYLKKLPSNITHLYFTLSSWKAPNLSAFTNPSLSFYDASEPEMNLCSTTFKHALDSQAVVMCSVVRKDKTWHIFECDVSGCVNGNSKRYNPIRRRIRKLIKNDLYS